MSISFPGESPEYRAARDRLLKQEVELRRATEAVAAARRELPPGGAVPEDYVFQEAEPGGTPTDVRLSELFVSGKDTLAIYSFMFPRAVGARRPRAHEAVDRERVRAGRVQARQRRVGRGAAAFCLLVDVVRRAG